jgi:hypothetical protein
VPAAEPSAAATKAAVEAPPRVEPGVASAKPVVAPAVEPHVAPRPAAAWLSVETNKPVTLSLDGTLLGPAPLRRTKIAPGEHRLKLESAGLSRTVHLNARAGDELARKEIIRDSTLNVTVDPWADVWLDGTKLGQTPLVREVWDGHHELKLVGPHGAKKTLAIDLVAGKPLVIDETLARSE